MLHERIQTSAPLVVDLDRTLIANDIAMEQMIRVGRGSWRALAWLVLAVVVGLWRGPARLKARLARRAPVDATTLPYRAEVLALIAAARAEGRPVILATASHARIAARVARHLGLFDRVIATSARTNTKGAAKLDANRAS